MLFLYWTLKARDSTVNRCPDLYIKFIKQAITMQKTEYYNGEKSLAV